MNRHNTLATFAVPTWAQHAIGLGLPRIDGISNGLSRSDSLVETRHVEATLHVASLEQLSMLAGTRMTQSSDKARFKGRFERHSQRDRRVHSLS